MPRSPDDPVRGAVPPGVALLLLHSHSAEAIATVHQRAQENIVGYAARNAEANGQERAKRIRRLFEGQDSVPPESAFVIAAVDSDTENMLYGAAVVDASVPPGLVEHSAELARNFARHHYVLSGLFVDPQARGRGLGRTLIEAAVLQVVHRQGRYLDGFVDERNGSAGFYASVGATVSERNHGLPKRPPTYVTMHHVPGYDGHWFYFDGWAWYHDLFACARCEQPLGWNPADGGSFHCTRCEDDRPTS